MREGTNGDGYAVLCVDDEQPILDSLQRLFAGENYDLVTTANPNEALEITRKRNISLIITDQRMPLMCGTDLLKSIRDFSPHTIRVVLTGCADLEWVTEAINEAGIHWLIHKPWDNEQLKLSIRMLLEQYGLRNNEDAHWEEHDPIDMLFRAYGATLLNYARSKGLRHQDAEDLCQEVFVKLCDTKFRSFLLSIMRNILIDRYRHENAQKRGGKEKIISLDQLSIQLSSSSGLPNEQLDIAWIEEMVKKTMTTLKEHCEKRGTPYYLALQARIDGKSYLEIAKELSMTVDQIRSHIQQARFEVKRILGGLVNVQSVYEEHKTEQTYILKFL